MTQAFFEDTFYLQRMLKFAGYDCGKIDGIRGNKTNKAIEQWLLDADKYKRQFGALDARTEGNLSSLLPHVQGYIRKWFNEHLHAFMAKHNVIVKVICGTRTISEQNKLYAQGRTTKGSKVTNAKGGYSMHNFGIAFDIGIFNKDGSYITTDNVYKLLVAECGTPQNMLNGGAWQTFQDYPHYELAEYGSKSANVRKVWNKLK